MAILINILRDFICLEFKLLLKTLYYIPFPTIWERSIQIKYDSFNTYNNFDSICETQEKSGKYPRTQTTLISVNKL